MLKDSKPKAEAEANRIKGLHEFGINIEECQIIFSNDLKYSVLTSQVSLASVDMTRKVINSKVSNEKNARIAKVKITNKNSITYINKKSSRDNEIVITSIDFIGDYYEYKIQDDVLDYIYVEHSIEDAIDYLFVITTKGDLMLYNELQLIKRVNICNDTKRMIKPGFNVSRMEFISETKNLIIITSSGMVVNYVVCNDPEDMNSVLKTIDFEEVIHLDSLLSGEASMNQSVGNSYEVALVKKNLFICDLSNINTSDMEIESLQQNKKKESIFLTIGYIKNTCDTFISFFEIQSNQLLYLNQLELNNRILLDMHVLNSYNCPLCDVHNYLILCLKISGMDLIEFKYADYLDCFRRSEEGNQTQPYLREFNEIEDNSKSLRKIAIIDAYVTSNHNVGLSNKNDSHRGSGMMEELEKSSRMEDTHFSGSHSVNLIVRKLLNFNNFNCYIVDCDVYPKIFSHAILDNELIQEALTTDVNQYLQFLSQNNNSISVLEMFKQKVLDILSNDITYHGIFSGNSNITMLDAKIEPYLLLLIHENDIFALRYFISLKDPMSTVSYLVSNEKLNHTVFEYFYMLLRSLIVDQLRSNTSDYSCLINDTILANLKTVLEIMKVIRNRNENPSGVPFLMEREILTEEASEIDRAIFDIENTMLIVKILRSYANKIENDINMGRTIVQMNEAAVNLLNVRKEYVGKSRKNIPLTYFELMMLNENCDYYPEFRRMFMIYFINFDFEEMKKKAEPQTKMENILYFTKLQMFFYYFYFICDYLKIKANKTKIFGFEHNLVDKNIFLELYFSEMEEEFLEYFTLCLNMYKLDLELGIKADSFQRTGMLDNSHCVVEIEISALSNFIIKISKLGIAKSKIFTDIINISKINFSATLISMLESDHFSLEALTLSKNILGYINEYPELSTQLSLLLKMGLINLAYQFVNNCFAYIVCYSEEFESITSSNPGGNLNFGENLLNYITNSKQFDVMKTLYDNFFDYLIQNGHLNILFSLPYNFFERYLLKDFLLRKREYEEFLIIYFLKLRKVKEAEKCMNDYLRNMASSYSGNSNVLYGNLIETLKYIYSEPSYEQGDNNSRGAKHQLLSFSGKALSDYHRCFYIDSTMEIERKMFIDSLPPQGGEKGVLEIKNIRELANKLIEDSLLDIENIPYKPTPTSLNETIQSLLNKKQATGKKTLGLFTEYKPKKTDESMLNVSEKKDRYYLTASITMPNFNIDTENFTPTKGRKLILNSNISLKTSNSKRGMIDE